MEFAVLGSLELRIGGRQVDVGWPKQRALLAALLLSPNRMVSVDGLVDAVWGDEPPASAPAGIQKYVSGLRRLLGASRILTRPPGYLVVVGDHELDLLRFDTLTAAGAAALGRGDRVGAIDSWTHALVLWRGSPLDDVRLGESWRPRLRALEARRASVRAELIDARLANGEHNAVLSELEELVAADPTAERHWAQLMRALHAAGRSAEALAIYARADIALADRLGVEPGAELRVLHSEILASDGGSTGAPRTEWTVQCQLPLDIGVFVGREATIAEIAESLTSRDAGVPVVTVSGPPGVGKTALVVRIAHRLRSQFPDGQWFARLDGAGTAPRDPATVLADLLQSSGIVGAAVPEGLDARAAALRARLADRRVLLVLDDAADPEQVRPLLPGVTGSAVLVSSRNTLGSLAVLDGAVPVSLDLLPERESVALLRRVLSVGRAGAEPQVLSELAALCGHLPLALRIAAANLAMHPDGTGSVYVAELRAGNRLAKLAVRGDERVAVRVAFDLSYRALPSAARRAFRLISLIPGPDFAPPAVAALLNVLPDAAEAVLVKLAAASFIQEKTPGRFQFHDLLRVFALERTAAEDHVSYRSGAMLRLYGWSVHATSNARTVLNPHRRPDRIDAFVGRARPPRFGGYQDALRWHRQEQPGLMAVLRAARAARMHRTVWQLATAMIDYLLITSSADDWLESHLAALDACRELGERAGEAHVLNGLGIASETLFRHESALEYFSAALEIRRVDGDEVGVSAVLGNMVTTLRSLRRFDEAVRLGLRASETAQGPMQQAVTWSNVALTYLDMGRFGEVLVYAGRARDLWGSADSTLAAPAWHNIGAAHAGLGHHAEARSALDEALRLAELTGRSTLAGETLLRLGDLSRDEGDHGRAATEWRRAWDLLSPLGHPWAAKAKSRLAGAAGLGDSHPQAPNG